MDNSRLNDYLFDKFLNIALKTALKYASKTHVKGSRTHFLLTGNTNIAKDLILIEKRGLFIVFLTREFLVYFLQGILSSNN